MPIKLAPDLADRMEAEIRRHPEGIPAASLYKAFAEEASPRSLLRILDRLVRRERIVAKGGSRATRYLPLPSIQGNEQPPFAQHQWPNPPRLIQGNVQIADSSDTPLTLRAEAEVYVPLTGESPMLRDWVRRPITQRRPVGYDRKLLDAYRPNETFYLNDADWRTRLRDIGRTPPEQRPANTYARDILSRLLIDLSWASSHLEGNTYSRLDTQNLIEHGREAEGKGRLEAQMILNHKRAIEFLVEQAEDTGFDMHTFGNLHALLSENLLDNPADEGRLRERIVEIGGTVYRPLHVPQQIEELFRLILDKAGAIADPFEQALFLMVHIPYLQPFMDVNKRVSRLGANIPFIKNNLCPLSFIDVPERAYVEGTLAVYEHGRVDLLRDVFTWAYERSCDQFKAVAGTLPEPDPFRQKYRAELVEAVAAIVREGKANKYDDVRKAAANLVPAEDQQRFASMVSKELRHLHEGSIARYKLRLAEFRVWREKQV